MRRLKTYKTCYQIYRLNEEIKDLQDLLSILIVLSTNESPESDPLLRDVTNEIMEKSAAATKLVSLDLIKHIHVILSA